MGAPSGAAALRFESGSGNHILDLSLLEIDTPPGAPIAGYVIQLPAGLDLAAHGFRACLRVELNSAGPPKCPAETRVGSGKNLIRFRQGSVDGERRASVSVFLGPMNGHDPTLLFYSARSGPVPAFSYGGVLRHGRRRHADELRIVLPPIRIAGAPDAALYLMDMVIGARRVRGTYQSALLDRRALYGSIGARLRRRPLTSRRTNRRSPSAYLLSDPPSRCPRRGFRWTATFTFEGGTTSSSTSTSACSS
jgi:hypothetical protein